MKVPFLKVSGAGNDFVLVDDMAGELKLDWAAFARAVCVRRSGIGADGLLVVERSALAPMRMLYLNADGSSGGMCGNGGRCVARYASERGIAGREVSFEACGSLYHAVVESRSVRLKMTDIRPFGPAVRFPLHNGEERGSVLDTGSPHVVIDRTALDAADVEQTGRMIRRHPLVKGLGGANVNFMYHSGPQSIRIRTYERGVEGETLACGTGAVAAAAVAMKRGMVTSPITVLVESGDVLLVSLRPRGEGFTDVWLEGGTSFLFRGELMFDPASGSISHLGTGALP